MLLPLLSPELSRPRDAVWGAVLLLLGLVLITGADRLSGSPMLAVLCGGLLIGRLGGEVMQLRWSQLTPEEQQRLSSLERWQTSFSELTATLNRGGAALSESLTTLTAALQRGSGRGKPTGSGKRWVRPETADSQPEPSESATVVVSSFAEIDALIEAASTPQHSEAG
jgi:isoleucyl-tRNA synthetase